MKKSDLKEFAEILAEAINPKPKKTKKAKNKFVIIIDGAPYHEMAGSKKEAVKAATAVKLAAISRGVKEPQVAVAPITEVIEISVPTTTIEINGIEG